MIEKIQDWAKLPSGWIEAGGLKKFRWDRESGSTQTAALMLLIAIAHHTSQATGLTRLSYDDLVWITGLSRTKIADGLEVLEDRGLIVRKPMGRSTYQLVNFNPARGWAMLPARGLYTSDGIGAFHEFHLRKRSELDALKAYLAFVARRNREFNRAYVTYEKLEEYAGIPQARIKTAITILAVTGLVVVDQLPSSESPFGVANAYRLTSLNPRNHQGTRGRSGEPLSDPWTDFGVV